MNKMMKALCTMDFDCCIIRWIFVGNSLLVFSVGGKKKL